MHLLRRFDHLIHVQRSAGREGTTFAGGWPATVVVVEWWFIISFLLPCSGRVTFGDFVVALVTVFLPVAGAFLFA